MSSYSPSSLAAGADWLAAWIEQRKAAVLVLFSLILWGSCLSIAATKVMWSDELSTYYPARLPTVAEQLAFFREGLDVHTPTSSLLMRASIAAFGDNHMAF